MFLTGVPSVGRTQWRRTAVARSQYDTQPTLLSQIRAGRYTLQEAQLSQRDRVTLHVIEYIAKSLTVTQGHSK